MPFEVQPTAIPEVLVVRPKRFGDDRGWFAEVWQDGAFAELGGGLPTSFVQVNQSRSARGVVRGHPGGPARPTLELTGRDRAAVRR